MEQTERVSVSLDDALRRIGPGEMIHTYRDSGPALIGADWKRAHLIDHMRQYGVEETGPIASASGYGLAVIDSVGPVFIATVAGQE